MGNLKAAFKAINTLANPQLNALLSAAFRAYHGEEEKPKLETCKHDFQWKTPADLRVHQCSKCGYIGDGYSLQLENKPAPEFKVGDWVMFIQGPLRPERVTQVWKGKKRTKIEIDDNTHYRYFVDLYRYATFEEKFRKGAKVRITKDGSRPILIEALLAADQEILDIMWKVVGLHAGYGNFSKEHFNCELLEAAPVKT